MPNSEGAARLAYQQLQLACLLWPAMEQPFRIRHEWLRMRINAEAVIGTIYTMVNNLLTLGVVSRSDDGLYHRGNSKVFAIRLPAPEECKKTTGIAFEINTVYDLNSLELPVYPEVIAIEKKKTVETPSVPLPPSKPSADNETPSSPPVVEPLRPPIEITAPETPHLEIIMETSVPPLEETLVKSVVEEEVAIVPDPAILTSANTTVIGLYYRIDEYDQRVAVKLDQIRQLHIEIDELDDAKVKMRAAANAIEKLG